MKLAAITLGLSGLCYCLLTCGSLFLVLVGVEQGIHGYGVNGFWITFQ